MSLGIDIYRYQTVTDWRAVRNARIRIAPGRDPQPIEWIYRKLTDGNGLASSRGDGQIAGARSVGFPVGGYHFAQPGIPRAQAQLLLGEARRLNALELPPMLDLEDNPAGSGKPNIPDGQKKAWAIEFLDEITDAGFRPCLYLSSALAKALRPDQWNVPGLVLWIASYGPNNGFRNALTGGYPGRVDIHQYTSTGRVPGISGAVDLNEATIKLLQEDDMPSVQEIVDAIKFQILAGDWRFEGNRNPIDMAQQSVHTGFVVESKVDTALAKLDGITAAVGAIHDNPDISRDELVRIVNDAVPDADQIAAAIRPGLVAQVTSTVRQVVHDVLGEDNAEQAAEILRQLGAKLTPAAQEGTPQP
jgi:GH25 family lysozyme M1 (1,4-beta-N-acetylmuramidase)